MTAKQKSTDTGLEWPDPELHARAVGPDGPPDPEPAPTPTPAS